MSMGKLKEHHFKRYHTFKKYYESSKVEEAKERHYKDFSFHLAAWTFISTLEQPEIIPRLIDYHTGFHNRLNISLSDLNTLQTKANSSFYRRKRKFLTTEINFHIEALNFLDLHINVGES